MGMDSFFVKPGGNKKQKSDYNGSNKAVSSPGMDRGSRGRGSRRGGRDRGTGGRGRGRGGRGFQNSSHSEENGSSSKQNGKKRFRLEDEEISSGSSDEGMDNEITLQPGLSESEDEETEQEKRLRLTKDYLHQLEEYGDEKDVDIRLREEALEAAGRLRRALAKDLIGADSAATVVFKGHSGHKLSATCVTSDGKLIFSGGKEGAIIKWGLIEKKLLLKVPADKTEAVGHAGAVLALALSSDSKYLASGSVDKVIKVWNVLDMSVFHTFKGHRDSVSGVAFRMNTHQLFSCGHDRNVKVWNVDEKAYVETLFGHQNEVTAVDCFHKERCITSGGRDSSVRIWKILEESQLVFQLPAGSIECISLVDEEHFVTGDDDGSVALWGAQKKKPLYTLRQAHRGTSGAVCWVASIDALKNTDLFASGSNSGEIKVWRIQDGFRAILPHFTIAVVGFVNSLKIVNDGQMIVAGIGQEHRLGRWWRISEAKNCVSVFVINKAMVPEIVVPAVNLS